jgi:hypothetical protein
MILSAPDIRVAIKNLTKRMIVDGRSRCVGARTRPASQMIGVDMNSRITGWCCFSAVCKRHN